MATRKKHTKVKRASKNVKRTKTDKPSMTDQLKVARKRYTVSKSSKGSTSAHNGDDVATLLAGSSPEDVCSTAEKLAELAPGDLNHVFFTTGGSTAVDSALRFLGFYNNFLGRPEKKHIISRQDAYHGSTYLTASVSGKSRDKEHMDMASGFIHLLASPNPFGRPASQSLAQFCDERVTTTVSHKSHLHS